MARRGWVMKLKPGNEAIYKHKHDEIWPEMLELMRRGGTSNYSIYRYGLLLFAYQENNGTGGAGGPPYDPVLLRWWKMMEPYMEYNADGTPWSEPIEEVFHAD